MTEDKLFGGRLRLFQPARGYRFSIDAILLAHFASARNADNILDLGAGCGVISLILAYRRPETTISALELQDGLFQLLRRNIESNNYSERITPIQGDLGDIREVTPAEAFDLVISNPPYRTVISGRQNPADEEAIARHELKTDMVGTVASASYAVCNRGRAAFVYPAERLVELMLVMRDHRLEPKRLQTVHGYPGAPARMVLLEAVKNGGGELKILPPSFIYQEKKGEYTPEMAAMYRTA